MKAFRPLCSLLLSAGLSLSPQSAQAFQQPSVSSDDISVAEGLQLPTYGHVWALDKWDGVEELVRLRPPDANANESGLSVKLHRGVDFKGEAAGIRVHGESPTFFVRGVSGDAGRSDLAVVRLNVDGQRRTVSKEALAQLKQQAKHADGPHPELIDLEQQRVGQTDWYRLSVHQALAPGEYALIPRPGSQGFADGEIFDFAVDPAAPENRDPLRSERFRGEK